MPSTEPTPERERPKISEQRKRLWEALNEFIHKSGGWLVSSPGEKYLRVEIERGSALVTTLDQMGYDVRSAGVSTRVTSNGLIPTEFVSFTLPK
jgi:hypothetical protein